MNAKALILAVYAALTANTLAHALEQVPTLSIENGQFVLNIPYLEFQTHGETAAYAARLNSSNAAQFLVDFRHVTPLPLRTAQQVTDNPVNLTDEDKELLNLPDDFQPTDNTPVVNANEPDAFAGTLAAHNRYRSEVGVGNLAWSDKLAQVAQSWAKGLQQQGCAMQHSGNQYGENLYWAMGFTPTITQAIDSWGKEKQNYHYGDNRCAAGKVCGHYTQIVWQNTTHVGCGMAQCDHGNETIVVCNYDPAGNYIGQKPY